MMKKYEFKLEAVLKLRKLNEENCRMELGALMLEMQKIDNQVEYEKQQIDIYYKMQEEALKVGAGGAQLQLIPNMVAAKTKNIQLLNRDKRKQQQLIDAKRQELAVVKGELKVMENLKEKDFQEYKKALNKEIDQKVEEQTQLWLMNKKQEM
jgi:flagellar FliJ protein